MGGLLSASNSCGFTLLPSDFPLDVLKSRIITFGENTHAGAVSDGSLPVASSSNLSIFYLVSLLFASPALLVQVQCVFVYTPRICVTYQ